jgi:hypothetical protein
MDLRDRRGEKPLQAFTKYINYGHEMVYFIAVDLYPQLLVGDNLIVQV